MVVKFGPDLTYFLWSLAVGIFLAAVYDFFRVVRKTTYFPNWLVNLSDIVFLVFSAVVSAATAYFFNNGELRVYALLCTVGAFLIYKISVGDRLVKRTVKLVNAVKKAVYNVTKKTFMLFWKPIHKLRLFIRRRYERKEE